MLNWYQHLPLFINPVAFSIGSFSIRWYAISYIIGFGVVYCLLIYRIRRGESKNIISNSEFRISNQIVDFLLYAFIAALVGGRIGYVLLYNFSYFWAHPLAVISPYDISSGQYSGIYGMSYHGALLGVIVMMLYFCKKNRLSFWQWADFIAPAISAGYFFGRIGNFLNGELYGRVTDSSVGMYFAQDPLILLHPSQIYEAFAEGIVLFAVLWTVRNKKYRPGTLSIIYVMGYGMMRFMVEFFRQPDPQIGFLAGYFTLGQLLCIAMIAAGAFLSWKKIIRMV